MFQNFTFDAGGRLINAAATYIRYEAETGGAINAAVRIRANGQDLGEWLPGDSANLPAQVTMIEVTPVAGAVGAVRLGIGDISVSRVSLSGQVGASIVVNKVPQADFLQSSKAATPASAQLLPANPARQYLLVQNKDNTGAIWLFFGAAAATQANGVRIGPGGNYEPPVIPKSAIQVVGDIANNTNLVVLEG